MWTLPGKKFAYVFDPNTMPTIRGLDIDCEIFLPEVHEVDFTLKGFNKGSKSDRPKKPKEPKLYEDWVNDFNDKYDSGFFNAYDWLCIDSVTFLQRSCMDRTLYLNGRYGDIEDLSDYRVVGSKLTNVFNSITSLPCNLYCTGHLRTTQDERTKKIAQEINVPGNARNIIPLMMSNVWKTFTEEDKDGNMRYLVRTKPEPRGGFVDIRCCFPILATEEDVTIEDFGQLIPGRGGIGGLLALAEQEFTNASNRRATAGRSGTGSSAGR